MIKNILLLIFLFITASLFSQTSEFRMVGNGTWGTVDDSTYTSSITFQSDLTGFGYLATTIDSTFRLFTPTEQLYRIDSVWNKTFTTADVRVVEISPTNGSPTGQLLVFDPNSTSTIPQGPFASTGSTGQMQAAVDTWNARQVGAASAGDIVSGTYNGKTIVLNKSGGGTVTITGSSPNTSSNVTLNSELAVFGDCSSGSITLTLPAPASLSGKSYYITKVDNSANPLILSGTFNSGTQKLIYHNQVVVVDNNGSFWFLSN